MTAASTLGVGLALAGAVCFEGSYVLQALEARRVLAADRPGIRLVARLARRPWWVAGIALSVIGFALQVLALREAPLAIVQPVLALGLVLLLALSHWVLHERVGWRELAAVAGVITGVVLVVLAAPARGGAADATGLAIACPVLAAVLLAPFALRTLLPGALMAAAAAGDALAALTINEVARALIGRPLEAVAWAALAAAAGLLALAAESTALQRSPANVVAPAVLAGQVAVPVLLAPLVAGERWGDTPGGGALILVGLALVVASAVALTRSPALGTVRSRVEGETVDATDPELSQER